MAAVLPLLYAFEGTAAATLILRGRYDLRGGLLALSTAVRLVAIVVAAPHGVTATVVALVLGQASLRSSSWRSGSRRCGASRARRRRRSASPGEIVRFVLHSSAGTGLVSLRGWLAPVLLGIVSDVARSASSARRRRRSRASRRSARPSG